MPRTKRSPKSPALPRVVQMTFTLEELAAINAALLFAVAVIKLRPNQPLIEFLTHNTGGVLDDLGNEPWHNLMLRLRTAALEGFPNGNWKTLDDVILTVNNVQRLNAMDDL